MSAILPDTNFFSGHRKKSSSLSKILLLPTPPMSPSSSHTPSHIQSITSFYTQARAENYDNSAFHIKLASSIVSSLDLPPASSSSSSSSFRVLDLATGTGLVALEVAKGGFEVIGVDVSGEMLSVAREKAKKEGLELTFLIGDAQEPRGSLENFIGMGFDRIVCSSAITFLLPNTSLLAWSHLLRASPSSTIVFDVPSPESSIRNVLLSQISSKYGLTPRFNRRWITSKESVREVVEQTGRLVVRSLTGTGIVSTKKVATTHEKAEEVWEETLKVTNMNPYPEAVNLGKITADQFAESRASFIEEWMKLGDGAGSEIDETMENWLVVCALKV